MSKTFTLSESFKARANTACFWEAWVGACIARMGLYTRHAPLVLDGKPGASDLAVCGDFWGDKDDIWTDVEVKSSNLTFNNAADYPKDPVLVCSFNGWQRKRKYFNTPSALDINHLIVSRITGAIVWVPANAEVGFSETYDNDRGELYKTVTIKKSDLRDFIDFVEQFNEV